MEQASTTQQSRGTRNFQNRADASGWNVAGQSHCHRKTQCTRGIDLKGRVRRGEKWRAEGLYYRRVASVKEGCHSGL